MADVPELEFGNESEVCARVEALLQVSVPNRRSSQFVYGIGGTEAG